MALTPSFTVSNNSGVDQSIIQIVDTSTGSDGAIANRLIYLYQADNTLVTGTPINFLLASGASISPSILTKDYAVNVVLNWVDSGGNVLYTSNQIFVFTGFLEWFFYKLTQNLAAQPNLANDTNFLSNYSNLRNYIDSANQSIVVGASVFNAQNMVLLAQQLASNQNLYF